MMSESIPENAMPEKQSMPTGENFSPRIQQLMSDLKQHDVAIPGINAEAISPLEAIAKIGYRAYGETTEYKNYQGLPMPTWEELPPRIQQAWIAASSAVMTSTLQCLRLSSVPEPPK